MFCQNIVEKIYFLFIIIFLSFLTCSNIFYKQIEESDEARKKFSNAKSISSSQFYGDQGSAKNAEAQASLQKFSVSVWLILFGL